MQTIDEALTFDDVLLQPAYSEILPREVSLQTRLTRGLTLNIPIVSAAMDTVTEARLAITLAQEGGIGTREHHLVRSTEAEVRSIETSIATRPGATRPRKCWTSDRGLLAGSSTSRFMAPIISAIR